jgi:hypothetical protein
LVPAERDLDIATDSKSSIDSIYSSRDRDWARGQSGWKRSFTIPQRKRILTAGRPIVNCIRGLISARSGATSLRHVRAHTGGSDLDSRGNDLADSKANVARIESEQAVLPFELAGEDSVTLSVRGCSASGSYRRAMRKAFAKDRLDSLAAQKPDGTVSHQHRLAVYNRSGVSSFCTAAQKSHSPDLMKYAMLANMS